MDQLTTLIKRMEEYAGATIASVANIQFDKNWNDHFLEVEYFDKDSETELKKAKVFFSTDQDGEVVESYYKGPLEEYLREVPEAINETIQERYNEF